MDALTALKHAALEAFDTEDGPRDMAGFFSIIDPQSALIEIAAKRIIDEEAQSLHQVIAELGDYIRRTAPRPEAEETLLRTRQIVSNTSRKFIAVSTVLHFGNFYKSTET